MSTREKIVLAMPRSGSMIHDGAAKGFFLWPSKEHDLCHMEASHSAATHTFNRLWCEALMLRKQGFRYFAMMHNDVVPGQFWLDRLMEEYQRLQADVISAVIPIKSDDGLTSTAMDKGDLWNCCRLTMKEVMELPESFESKDVGFPLLVNNGLWLCDMTQPWCEKFSFEILNRIGKTKDGLFFSQLIPEDWHCSRKFHDLGLRVFATRKVQLYHEEEKFNNYSAWGKMSRDEVWYGHNERAKVNKPAEETVCV